MTEFFSMKNIFKRKSFLAIIILVIIAAGLSMFYLYSQHNGKNFIQIPNCNKGPC